jgi:hypothetical protein
MMVTHRQLLIDAHRRCQPLGELRRKADRAARRGMFTLEDFDYALASAWTASLSFLADADLDVDGEDQKR